VWKEVVVKGVGCRGVYFLRLVCVGVVLLGGMWGSPADTPTLMSSWDVLIVPAIPAQVGSGISRRIFVHCVVIRCLPLASFFEAKGVENVIV